jgi:hypothetical protein
MTTTAEDVLKEGLQLSESERARVAAELLQASNPTSRPARGRDAEQHLE